jgi:GTP-binding protein
MIVNEAVFICSNTELEKCPDPVLPEYAFIGRSNVGKSSLINMLTGRTKLAKTSSTPGKTQLINHFKIDNTWYLVDLPGYGYAKISKTEREKWHKMIHDYLFNRENLVCTFVLIDSRHSLQQTDLEFMEMLALNQVPFNLIFTKTDKLKKNQVEATIEAYLKEMLEFWEDIPRYFVTSAETGSGRTGVLEVINGYNQIFTESRKV